MNLPDRPAIRAAYEKAVVALLNAIPEAEEAEAEAFVDAMADLIFTTMQTYINEEESHDTADHH
jgi:hypothetical protein